MALTPPPIAPQRNDRSTFSARLDAFITWLINFVTELVSLVANLNSLAAGGAYSLPYTIQSSSTTVGGTAGGNFALTSDGTGMLIDTKSAQGANVAGVLLSATAASGAVRGSVRIVKQGDPSVYLLYNITNTFSVDAGGLFGYFAVSFVAGNGSFSEGSGVMLFFDRNGEQTAVSDVPTMIVREQTTAGVNSATSLVAATWVKRQLNTIDTNTIPGATLSSGVIGLPAGTYEIKGDAPAIQCGAHKTRFVNTVDAIAGYGTPEIAPTGTAVSNRSFVTWRFTTTAAKNFELQHIVASSAVGGTAANLGSTPETYGRIEIKKVA